MPKLRKKLEGKEREREREKETVNGWELIVVNKNRNYISCSAIEITFIYKLVQIHTTTTSKSTT